MKKLGFGLMRLPLLDKDDPTSIDIELTKKMVDECLARGFRYFDTAWMYCGGKSECAVKEILTERYPRDSFLLADKLHARYLKTPEDRDTIFNTQREKTGVEYFDYYLLHDVGVEHYKIFEELDCFSWIAEKKQKGLAKKIGFSFHDSAEFLDRVLTEHPEFDFVQLQINYLDWESESVQSRLCLETARRHGKPVIVMEPVKGGTLAAVPDAVKSLLNEKDANMSIASWAIRFAAGLEGVMLVLSGMSNMEQLLDNLSYMEDFKPLSEDEVLTLKKAASIINLETDIPCTGCAYCVGGCPKNIPIPKYFSLYNADLQEVEGKGWTPQHAYFDNLVASFGKPEDCIGCKKCEQICPQHIKISAALKKVAAHFGS